MNIKRITSSLLGFPLIAALLIFGNKYVVDVAIAIFALIALNEFFNAFKEKANPIVEVGYASTILIAVMHLFDYTMWFMAIPIIVFLLFFKVVITKMKVNVVDVAITLLGIIYIVGMLAFIPFVNGQEHGKLLIWYIIIAAWGTDIFAYIIGKRFGKHKLNEISPKKSIEGAIGGIVGSTVLMIIYTMFINYYFELNMSYIYVAIVGVILSIIGQVGDFAASTVKRYVGIKDFSNLIPGHGGIIDRIDSVMFVAPFVYLFFVLIKSVI